MNSQVEVLFGASLLAAIVIALLLSRRKKFREKINQPFPEEWREILADKVLFYKNLDAADAAVFEKRVQLFLATKFIEGVKTTVDDTIRLLVASSAVIPTFAFPNYNYPRVSSVLIYPNSFDEQYGTERYDGHQQNITGMVSNHFQNGTVIFSAPDLIRGFANRPDRVNVGIHEFVHMLDKEDGDIDGIPETLLSNEYVAPWLREIKKEMARIEKGKSDINPYALTNNAEFLAVVSEYFFDHPEKFKTRHPELYERLAAIFNAGEGE